MTQARSGSLSLLTHLEISGREVVSFDRLAELLGLLPNLTSLKLRALISLYGTRPSVFDSESKFPILAPVLARLEKLTELDLSWNLIGEHGLSSLVNATPVWPSLTHLNLGTNWLQQGSSATLLNRLLSSLPALNLWNAFLYEKGIPVLLDLIPRLGRAKLEINLSRNFLGPEGV